MGLKMKTNQFILSMIITLSCAQSFAQEAGLGCVAKHPQNKSRVFTFYIPDMEISDNSTIKGVVIISDPTGVFTQTKFFRKIADKELVFRSGGYKLTLPKKTDELGDGFSRRGTLEFTTDAPATTNSSELNCGDQI